MESISSIEGGIRYSELEYLNLGPTRFTTGNLDDSSQEERDTILAINQACRDTAFPESNFLSEAGSGPLITNIDSTTGQATSGTGSSWATFDTQCVLDMTIKAATPLFAVLLMAAILFGFQTSVGNIQTLPSDFYSGKSVGTLAGYAGTAAKLAVVGLNFLIPVITVNSYAPAFAVGAALAILSVLSVWMLCGRIQPLNPPSAGST